LFLAEIEKSKEQRLEQIEVFILCSFFLLSEAD